MGKYDKELCHPYTNKKGRRIAGPAALNHYIYTVKGGIQEYNDEIGTAYINQFIKDNSDIINAGIVAKSKRDNFKVV